jgi:hypothetical protein
MFKSLNVWKLTGIILALLVVALLATGFQSQSVAQKLQITSLQKRVAFLEDQVKDLIHPPLINTGALKINDVQVIDGNIVVNGTTNIDPGKSTYIQYYVGKEIPNTNSNCIYAAGFNADSSGNFQLVLPVSKLKGNGVYKIALEQNPKSNTILPPEHFMAFYKDADGVVHFGDISSMGELSNLAITVGMHISECEVTVP